MPHLPSKFQDLPAPAHIKAALRELQRVYVDTIDKTEHELGKILARSAARQAETIIKNLTAFERRGTHIFATSKNLQLLEDLTGALAQLDVPARDSARQMWTHEALELRNALRKAGPELGLKLDRTDFARVSLATVQAAAANAFSDLSDFSQLQRGQLVGLKHELADAMARGLDVRGIAEGVKAAGIEALPAIPGFRRAFSVEERAESIGRTETVRIQTQLQMAMGDAAKLDYCRSFLNWALLNHADVCLHAEALGWVPVEVMAAGPGFPPRHPRCGCNIQRGLKEWVSEDEGPAAMARDFARNVAEGKVKLSAELVGKLPPVVRDELEQAGILEKARPAPPPPPPSFAAVVQKEIGTGVTSAAQARSVGKLVDEEWDSRASKHKGALEQQKTEILERRAVLSRQLDPMWDALIREQATNRAVQPSEELRRLHKEQAEVIQEQKVLEEQMAKVDREVLRETLSELRSLGGVDQEWAPRSPTAVKAAVQQASAFLPTAWLEASVKAGKLQGKKVARGFYRHDTPGRPAILALSERRGPDGLLSVALHELGHRMERVIPALLGLERELYEERTKGEALAAIPGHGRRERTRKDRFVHPYIGKDYAGMAYELLSVALESIWTGSFDVAKDKEWLHWALGLLAGA